MFATAITKPSAVKSNFHYADFHPFGESCGHKPWQGDVTEKCRAFKPSENVEMQQSPIQVGDKVRLCRFNGN